MENHVVVVHEKFKPFKCNECGKGLISKDNLRRHNVIQLFTFTVHQYIFIHLLSLENTYKVNGKIMQVQTFSAISVRKTSEKEWILKDTMP